MRLATSDDVVKIEAFYRRHGTANLHPRSIEHIKSIIDKGLIIMEETSSDGEIDACMEVLIMKTQEEIESFSLRHSYTFRYQAEDVLIYFAGLVKRTQSSANFFAERAFDMICNLAGVNEWKKAWHSWSLQDFGSISHPRPPRLILCFGVMDESASEFPYEEMLQYYDRCFSRVLTREKARTHTLTYGIKCPADARQAKFVFLFHDIPLTAHQMERTKRNRYLITEREQRRLLGTRIGFVGLSTGSVALEAFAREGVGGIMRITDYDKFEISNSNRMLFGGGDEGQSKIALCQKRIREIDPHIKVESFPEGISDANVDEFVKHCDIIIEECDDFRMKVLVRRSCQKFGVPLLMAASQNGMIDVERYDLVDSDTQPFQLDDQSVLDQLASTDLTAVQKNAALSKLYNLDLASPRFLGSGLEIGKTISSWPQLAEEVFLNAAVLVHAGRRILLGDDGSVVSGRFSVSMSDLFSPCNRTSTHGPVHLGENSSGLTTYPRDPYTVNEKEMACMKELLFVSYWARAAPSGGNQQPFTTRVVQDSDNQARIEIYFRKEAANYNGFVKDKEEGWIDMALGCMLLNAQVAAAHLDKEVAVSAIDKSPEANTAVTIKLLSKANASNNLRSQSEKKQLFHSLRHRASARSSHPVNQMPSALATRLQKLGVMIVDENTSNPISLLDVRRSVVQERKEKLSDLNNIFAEVGYSRFQLHPKVLGLSDEEIKAIERLSARPDVIDFVSIEGFLQDSLLSPFINEIDQTMVFMVLCDDGNDYVKKGELLELVWLTVTYHGYGVRPFSLHHKQLKSLRVPNAFFVLSLVEPHNLSICTSRL